MKSLKTQTACSLMICALALLLFPGSVHAWQPNTEDLDTAVNSGDFGGYFAKTSAWLNTKLPADAGSISEATLKDLLKNPVFTNTLDQRQLIAGHGVAELGEFAKADQNNKTFLAWFLRDTQMMDLYLEAAAGKGSVGALQRFRQIIEADPDAKEGVYLKLAMAIALWPPGGKSYGSGLPIDWMSRYKHYKEARENKELFPSFDTLSVWDMQHVVRGWSSDRDRAWVRQMVSTWRPDLRTDTKVINIVSEVWRRFSPFPFSDGFVSVMAGGGKCGPRSWFGQTTCRAFGLPSIAMGQPKHSAVAYKSPDPSCEPQPGSSWKICYGRGWHVTYDGYGLLTKVRRKLGNASADPVRCRSPGGGSLWPDLESGGGKLRAVDRGRHRRGETRIREGTQHAWFVGNDARGGRAIAEGNADVDSDAPAFAKGTRTSVPATETEGRIVEKDVCEQE